MARKLSKKKISGWILLFSLIAFFRCGGYDSVKQKIQSFHSLPSGKSEGAQQPRPEIDKSLAHRLDSMMNHIYSDSAQTGVFVYDVTAGKTLFAHNADEKMRPASNMKMLTCIAALRYLGPNYKFRHQVFTDGKLLGDSLAGNLIFRFDYDLQFNDSCLHSFVSSIDKSGIRRVGGKILLQLPLHEGIQHEEHWIPGDFRHSHTNMIFKGENVMKRNLTYALAAYTNLKFTTSQIEVLKSLDPSEAFEPLKPFETPLEKEIERALLNSSNENAEAISFLLGDKLLTDRSVLNSSTQRACAVRRLNGFIANQMHLDPQTVATIHDGSGLCIHDRLTPRFLVQMFLYAHEHQYIFNVLQQHLPVAGETGTLAHRMRSVREYCQKHNRPKLQAKTGTLTREGGITSLSGFCTGANGHILFFGIIQNNLPVADARLWQDKFCLQLVK